MSIPTISTSTCDPPDHRWHRGDGSQVKLISAKQNNQVVWHYFCGLKSKPCPISFNRIPLAQTIAHSSLDTTGTNTTQHVPINQCLVCIWPKTRGPLMTNCDFSHTGTKDQNHRPGASSHESWPRPWLDLQPIFLPQHNQAKPHPDCNETTTLLLVAHSVRTAVYLTTTSQSITTTGSCSTTH